MQPHRIRNLMAPVYGLLVVVGFIISSTVGVIIAVAGAMLMGLVWSALSGGEGGRDRSARRARRR